MSSSRPTTMATSSYEKYGGSPPENYERYFVPAIGLPSARPLLEAARLREGERVLDVGCGTGVATRLAAEAVGPGGSVVGIDANPAMLAVARLAVGRQAVDGSAAPAETSVEWRQAGAEDLPLPDGSFDAVLCAMALQFFTDQVAALREMRRVLTTGGRVVVATPGPIPPLFRALDEVVTDHLGPEASMFVNAVFSVHDPDEVRDLLDTAGFDDVHVDRRSLVLPLPPPADFFWQYVRSTPLSAVAAGLDRAALAAMEHDVVRACEPFVDGEGLVMRPGLLLATGRLTGALTAGS